MPEQCATETIPLLEEQVTIDKVSAVSDRLRLSTIVEERPVLVEEALARGDLNVEHVKLDRAVTEAPAPRHEGDTLIVSVVEERLVVEKRPFVIEELRITHRTTIERVAFPETVRTMRATVERVETAPATGNEHHG